MSSKSENPMSQTKGGRIYSSFRDVIIRLASTVENIVNHFLLRFSNPVVASKSYRYLARQVALNMTETEGGKLIVFSSATNMDINNEILLMFSHFLKDELASNVLVIDGTFGSSGLTRLLGLDEYAGFIDVLTNECDIANIESVTQSLKDNIWFIPVGAISKLQLPYVPEIQVKCLIDKLKIKYDYVILQQDNISMDTRYLPFAKSAELILLHLEEQKTLITSFDEIRDVFMEHQITNVKYILSEP